MRVEVGRDVDAEHLEVVTDVPDHRDPARIDGVDEPAHEAGATHSAAQDDDVHDASCSSSATVSTSSASAGTSSVTNIDADRFGVLAEALGAAGAVERREEAGA